MAGRNSRLEIFETGDFDEYAERLNFHFLANDIGQVADDATETVQAAADKKKCAVLISQLSGQVYSTLKNLCLPDKPGQKKFEELLKLLCDYFKPKISVVAATYQFQKTLQKEGESAIMFAARLKRAAMDCKFEAYLDRALRDQFITAIGSTSTTKEILAKAEETTTFQQVVDMATAHETAFRESEKFSTQVHAVRGEPGLADNATFKSDKPCFRCDKLGHRPDECHFKSAKCRACGKLGHIERACLKKKAARSVKHVGTTSNPGELVPCNDSVPMLNVNATMSDRAVAPYTTPVELNGVQVHLEIDTGSTVTLLGKNDFLKCNGSVSELVPSSITLSTYTGNPIKCLGEIEMKMALGGVEENVLVRVTECGGPSLLGRDVLSRFTLPWKSIFKVGTGGQSTTDFVKKYPNLFDNSTVGTVQGVQVKLHVSDEQPVYKRARPVPLAIRQRYIDALNKLEADGVIEKVTHSEWASPTIQVEKPGGGLRICADYSGTINKHSECEQYPLPTLEELLHKLGPGGKFTKLDLSQAYHQLEVAPESRKYTTINTIQGLYQYKRLPFGFHSAVSIFQRVMEETLVALPGSGGYIDDVLCTGENDEIHEENVDRVLHRLDEKGFKLNPEKFCYMAEALSYLGHTISGQGVSPSTARIQALKMAKPPQNVAELQSFIGSANFVRKFVPHFAEIAAPLYDLLKKGGKWHWETTHEQAFGKLKDAMCSEALLAHYDLQRPTVLQVDASGVGLGAVLLQKQENGELRPIAFMSRKLTPAESRYAQIEREALAVVFGVTKFRQYLLGREFIVVTDHRPLLKLLGNHEDVPTLASNRIKKWALQLAAYDYEMQYLAGKENVHADFLSRQPMQSVSPSEEETVTVQVLLIENDSIIKAAVVRAESAKDSVLAKVIRYTVNGWPAEIEEDLKAYASKRMELSVENDILLWDNRVVIPSSLRMLLLRDLHAEHFGMVKMKQVARRYLWWPHIDQDIESKVNACLQCQENAKCPPAKPGVWSWPTGPWKRIHIDFAGPFLGKMFLVVVDAYSKYLDVIPMAHATSATTISALRHLFSVFGLPEHLVTDNGSQFTSAEFQAFLDGNGILHTTTAPGHPATNGLAERYVGVFKQKMKEMSNTGEPLNVRLDRFLLAHRTTPTTSGKTPAELLMGRQPRIRLSALRQSESHRQVKVYQESLTTPKFNTGDAVFALNFGRGATWVPATVVHVHSPHSFGVQVDDVVWKRHRDQLRPRAVQFGHVPVSSSADQAVAQLPTPTSDPPTVLDSPLPLPDASSNSSTFRPDDTLAPAADAVGVETAPSVVAPAPLRRSDRHVSAPKRLIENC